MTAQLGITTSGWFEVELFDDDGYYLLRRHVETIEEAAALILNPPTNIGGS